MSNSANLAVEGNDPRDPAHPAKHSGPSTENQILHAAHDTSVTFEEYIYYAKITRTEEKAANARFLEGRGRRTLKSVVTNRFSKGHEVAATHDITEEYGSEKEKIEGGGEKRHTLGQVSDSEWKMASRATRTAGWSGVFYLITTDILGPYSVP